MLVTCATIEAPAHRRARPLLGTLVEISCPPDIPWLWFTRACDAAFAAIAQVHAAMSFHEPTSDIARLATAPAGEVLTLGEGTASVLRLAQGLERASEGAFNAAACAPVLVERGLLPRPSTPWPSPSSDTSLLTDLIWVDGDASARVQVLRPLWIDLGGIAKGWAVDQAVTALQAHGLDSALVNAGGDLRAFGDHAYPVSVRHPGQAGAFIDLLSLREGALATSAFQRDEGNEAHWPGAMVLTGSTTDVHQAACWPSVSVLAPACVIADALTKLLMMQGRQAAPWLRAREAHGILIDRQGGITHV